MGPLQVERDAQGPIELRSGRQRAIIAVLASRPGEAVSAERLIDAVWGEDPPSSARAALQVHIAGLRDALEPDRPDRSAGSYIGSRPGAYVLHADAGQLDTAEFEQLVADGRAAAAGGDFETAACLLSEALALWRGDAFEDVVEVVAEHAAWLNALRLDVEEDRMAAELAAGRHLVVVSDLERLVERQPLRERRVHLLMLALYRGGRQKDALASYRETRSRLIDELGVEPGAALRELDRAILQQGPELELPTATPASWVPPRRQGRRPATRPDLVERDADVKRVLSALDRSRLVGITGPAGVGKSVFARRVAHDIDHELGVWYVDLTAVTDGGHVLAAIADGVEVREAGSSDRTARIAATLGGGVLLLDDHDHVTDATVAVVRELLEAAPDLRIVATGREPLGLPGERVVRLAPLATDPSEAGGLAPATRLLVDRSGIDDWAPDQLRVLDELARRLDGLPLALELAAARLPALDPAAVLARLEGGPGLLRRTRAADPPHHRSLEEAVAWSHELLSEDARTVLDECSVFAAPFPLEAAEQLCADGLAPAAVAPALAELVERSFLTVDDDGPRVYRMYMAVRALGQGRLRAAGREEAVRAKHGVYMARFMARAATAFGAGPVVDARRALDRALPDLRAALDWLERQPDVELHHRAVAPLFLYWFASGRLSEGRARLSAAAARTGGARARYLDVLSGAAFLAWFQADYAAAQEYQQQCLDLVDDSGPTFAVLTVQGSLAWLRGEAAEARRCHHAAVALVRPHGDSWELAAALSRAANTEWFEGCHEEARAWYRESAEVAARIGNDLLRGIALRGESLNAALLGRRGEAQARADESLELGDRLGDRLNRGQSHAFAGLVDLACDDAAAGERSEAHLVAGASLAADAGDMFCLALATAGLAELARRAGDRERSVVLWSWLGHVARATGLPLPAAEQARMARALDEAPAALGPAGFERADRRGRELTLSGLVTLAIHPDA